MVMSGKVMSGAQVMAMHISMYLNKNCHHPE